MMPHETVEKTGLMKSTNTKHGFEDCILKVVKEPLEHFLRRYDSERCGMKIYSEEKNKTTGIMVEMENFRGSNPLIVSIECSLSTAEEDVTIRGPHFHKLKFKYKNQEQDELITSKVLIQKEKFVAWFTDLKIIFTKEKDHLKFYEEKIYEHYKEQASMYLAKFKTINCDEMCLKFRAFIMYEDKKHYICDPVYSQTFKTYAKNVYKRKWGENQRNKNSKQQKKEQFHEAKDGRDKLKSRTIANSKKIMSPGHKENYPPTVKETQGAGSTKTQGNSDITLPQPLPVLSDLEDELTVDDNGNEDFDSDVEDLMPVDDNRDNGCIGPISVNSSNRNEDADEMGELENILPQSTISYIMSEVMAVPGMFDEIAKWEFGYNSATVWTNFMQQPKSLYIIVAVLTILSFIDCRFISVLLFVLLTLPKKKHGILHTLKTILQVILLIFFDLTKFATLKLIILVLDKVIFRIISSEKKFRWMLTFLSLILRNHYNISNHIFDDSVLLDLRLKIDRETNDNHSRDILQTSEVVKLILFLRCNQNNCLQVKPQNSKAVFMFFYLSGFTFTYYFTTSPFLSLFSVLTLYLLLSGIW